MPSDKFCNEHSGIKLLVAQHAKRIDDLETMALDVSTDVGNIEGRVSTFIWVIGLTFFLLCSVAFYGVVSLNKFKEVYIEDAVSHKDNVSKLSAAIELSNYKMSRLSSDLDEIDINSAVIMNAETKQEFLDKVEDVLRTIDRESK